MVTLRLFVPFIRRSLRWAFAYLRKHRGRCCALHAEGEGQASPGRPARIPTLHALPTCALVPNFATMSLVRSRHLGRASLSYARACCAGCFSSSASSVRGPSSTTAAAAAAAAATALIFDTETTGRVDFRLPPSDPSQPDLVQLGMLLVDTGTWTTRSQISMLVRTRPGVTIEAGAQDTHGISAEDCGRYGVDPDVAMRLFLELYGRADVVVAHNLQFDAAVMEAALGRTSSLTSGRSENHFDAMISIGRPNDGDGDDDDDDRRRQRICTMKASTDLLRIPSKFGAGYKWPSLAEAYRFVADEELEGGHDALVDASACLDVFRYLVENGIVELGGDTTSKTAEEEAEQIDAKSAGSSIGQSAGGAKPQQQASAPNPSPEGVLVQRVSQGFVVSGKTYWIRAELKEHGGRWDHVRKEWRFSNMEVLPLIEELTGTSIKHR